MYLVIGEAKRGVWSHVGKKGPEQMETKNVFLLYNAFETSNSI